MTSRCRANGLSGTVALRALTELFSSGPQANPARRKPLLRTSLARPCLGCTIILVVRGFIQSIESVERSTTIGTHNAITLVATVYVYSGNRQRRGDDATMRRIGLVDSASGTTLLYHALDTQSELQLSPTEYKGKPPLGEK